MGTLRIKRGTKTALQSNPGYVPAEGELVYTTDTKEVFVGDGALTGGTPVSVSTQNLEDLGNVQALAAQNDQILVYNGSQWAATDNPAVDVRGNIYGDDSTLLVDAINGKIVAPVETTSVTATNLVGNLTGDVTGSVTGNVVGNTTGTHFGNVNGSVDGDVTGSVFADNSTILVDGVAGVLRGKLEGTADLTNLKVESNVVNTEAMQFNLVTNSQIGPGIRGESARNSLADPQDLQPADGILDIRGYGYYSGSYTINSVIRLKTAKYPTERRRGMRWRGASAAAVAGERKARGVGRGAARHLVAQPIVERVDVRGEAARRDVGQLHHHAGDARGAAGAGTADGGGGRGVGGRAPGEVEAVLQRQGRCSKACPGGRPARRVSRQMERQSARPNSERPRSAYARPRIAWPGDGCRTQSRGRRSWRNRPWAAEAGGGVTGGGGNGGR